MGDVGVVGRLIRQHWRRILGITAAVAVLLLIVWAYRGTPADLDRLR